MAAFVLLHSEIRDVLKVWLRISYEFYWKFNSLSGGKRILKVLEI